MSAYRSAPSQPKVEQLKRTTTVRMVSQSPLLCRAAVHCLSGREAASKIAQRHSAMLARENASRSISVGPNPISTLRPVIHIGPDHLVPWRWLSPPSDDAAQSPLHVRRRLSLPEAASVHDILGSRVSPVARTG